MGNLCLLCFEVEDLRLERGGGLFLFAACAARGLPRFRFHAPAFLRTYL